MTAERSGRFVSVLALAACLVSAACSTGAVPASAAAGDAGVMEDAAAPARAQTAGGAALDPEVAATVDTVLTSAEHPALSAGAIPDVAADLRPLYGAEPDRLLWFDGTRPLPAVDQTLAAVAAAADHGLNPADYDAPALAEQWRAIKVGTAAGPERALFDLGVSVAAARLLHAVHNGRVDPATMHWGYTIERKPVDAAALLREAREGKGLAALMDRLQPPFPHYARARRTLAAYRALAAQGEPPPVPDLGKAPSIKPGAAWAGAPQLAARLRAFGDLAAADAVATSASYSGPLVDAVKRFQDRHGLENDGVIGAGTVRALNVTLAERVRQIELAMERMRWLPDLSNRPNVFVNVPLFRLWATDPATGEEPLRMNVVVGQSLNHKTPLFVEQMEYVIFRPYWNPPRGITVKEIIPHQRRDASYFDREQLEIVASGADNAPALPPTPENLSAVVSGKLSVRQKPGPMNSLGLAKFIFPNSENVYMHGTPAQQLFSRARRDFSHGCIRLEEPARFAEWVLRDYPEWTRDRIETAMQGNRPTRVNLKQPLTVVLFYDTVHVNSEGVVFFVDDIYGHDRALDAALASGYPYPAKG
jgi:murein L,D-transpeptidase YcbB/YkuD